MAPRTILLIANRQAKDDPFVYNLTEHYRVLTGRSGKQGLELVQQQPPQLVVLDAASMNTKGERICRTLKTSLGSVPLIHIHPGPRENAASDADVMLFPPLSPKHLHTTIEHLINQHNEEIIACGPFRMNVSRRVLIAHGEEELLSPKLATLAEMFLRQPGVTIDRKTLMEAVWKTNYLGDTRTLDVHIRWIRKILENGSQKPRYLKTVRGVGYRLEIPDEPAE